jgi:hypothetical protein
VCGLRPGGARKAQDGGEIKIKNPKKTLKSDESSPSLAFVATDRF